MWPEGFAAWINGLMFFSRSQRGAYAALAGWDVSLWLEFFATQKASVILISRWPFALQKYPSHIEISNLQGVRLRAADCGEIEAFAFCAARQSSSRKHVILQGVSMPTADCGGEERR